MTSSKAGRHVRGEISSSSLCDLSFLFLPFYCLSLISLPFIFLYFSRSLSLSVVPYLFSLFSLVSYLSRELFKTTPTRLLWSVLQKHRNKTHSHTHVHKYGCTICDLPHACNEGPSPPKQNKAYFYTNRHTRAHTHARTKKASLRMHLAFRETCTSSDTISYS